MNGYSERLSSRFSNEGASRADFPRKLMIVTSGLAAGGAENVIATLSDHWAGRGIQVGLTVFDRVTPYYRLNPAVEVAHLDAETFARRTDLLRTAMRLRALRRRLREVRPDLVVSFLGKANVLAFLASRGLGAPVILSERNNPRMDGYNAAWRRARLACYQRADLLVLPTSAVREALPGVSEARIRVIPNPLSPLALERGARPRAPAAETTLVATGRLVRQKGFDLLLEAFARVAPERPDWRLEIFGEGPLRGELEALRDRLGLRGRAAFPGVSAEPLGWLSAGSAFVLSSRYEGFGNVLAEAMSAGMGVVSTDCGYGPGEIVTHERDGLLCPPEDVAALAEALRRVTGDAALRRRLACAARRTARERYAVPRIMAAWDEAIRQAAR